MSLPVPDVVYCQDCAAKGKMTPIRIPKIKGVVNTFARVFCPVCGAKYRPAK